MMLKAIKARDGVRLIPVSAEEFALLIRHAPQGAAVSSRFGTGGNALVAEDCPWALPLLAQWRGVAFAEGAGI